MAALWQVSHDDSAMPLIMKVPALTESDDPATIVGFEMEQMILPLVGGAHVPKVFAVGDYDGTPYIVMERIEGRSLLAKLDAAPLPIDEVIAIGIKSAEALNDLHRQHVIHLDIKPSNIMMRPSGEAVLIDFGLSHHDLMPDLLAEELRLPMGTGPYISPEQLLRNRTDPRSDIFSLGVLLYHLLTRQRPFGYPRSSFALRKRLWRDPVPPRALNAACPAFLQEIVLRCLEPPPERRYPTAAQLAFDLKNPDEVRLTERATRMKQDGSLTAARRWYKVATADPAQTQSIARRISTAPIVMVALALGEEALGEEAGDFSETLRSAVERVLEVTPGARLACVNVLRTNRIALNSPLNTEGRNIHMMRLIELREWARPLRPLSDQITFHVLEAPDAASALIDYARLNHVDQIVIAARANSAVRRLLGSVASRVVAEAPCTVTVVRDRNDKGDEPADAERAE